MIKITNLVKIYKDRNNSLVANKNINLTLGNNGMVFILGRSGSGKSTLLNIIGNLDSFDEGEITASFIGDYSKISKKEADKVRRNHIGFVFQDSELIDDLTVHENIKLCSQISNNYDAEKEFDVLKKLEIYPLLNKYPHQLSTGQRQRFSLARSILKRCDVILADEPTGNVDFKTGQIILDTLKMISNEKLVIVVSHNEEDANKFADRIIKINDGQIIDDVYKSKETINELTIKNNQILIPQNYILTKKDIINISEVSRKFGKDISVSQINNFKTVMLGDKTKVEIRKEKISPKKPVFFIWYFTKLYKTRMKHFALLICILSLLMSILGCLYSLSTYNGGQGINDLMGQYSTSILYKNDNLRSASVGSVSIDNQFLVSEDDQDFIEGLFGKDNVYSVYMMRSSFANETPSNVNYVMSDYVPSIYTDLPYAKYTSGTSIVDKKILNSIFNEGHEVEVLAGSLDDEGLIITDFIANSAIHNFRSINTYAELIFKDTNRYLSFNLPKIAAVIKTDIYEKYQEIFDDKKYHGKGILEYKEYNQFYHDFYNKYSMGYFLKEDYLNRYINSFYDIEESKRYDKGEMDNSTFQISSSSFTNIDLFYGDNKYTSSSLYFSSLEGVKVNNDDELIIGGLSLANSILGTNFADEEDLINKKSLYIDKTVTLTISDKVKNNNQESFLQKKLIIKDITIDSTGVFISNNLLVETIKAATKKCGFGTINPSVIGDYYEEILSKFYCPMENNIYKEYRTSLVLVSFKDTFSFISLIIFISVIVLFVFDAFTSIKKSQKLIGITKSFGADTTFYFRLFLTHNTYNFAILFFLVYGGYYLFAKVIDKTLCKALEIGLSNSFQKMAILAFEPNIFFGLVSMMGGMIFMSVILQSILYRKVKPINILRKRR